MMHGYINIKSTYICTSPANGITKLQNIFNAVEGRLIPTTAAICNGKEYRTSNLAKHFLMLFFFFHSRTVHLNIIKVLHQLMHSRNTLARI
jgi:hypothetical protein